MVQIWKTNKVLSINLVLTVLLMSDARIDSVETGEERHTWLCFVSYVVISQVMSLRGNKYFFPRLRWVKQTLGHKLWVIIHHYSYGEAFRDNIMLWIIWYLFLTTPHQVLILSLPQEGYFRKRRIWDLPQVQKSQTWKRSCIIHQI